MTALRKSWEHYLGPRFKAIVSVYLFHNSYMSELELFVFFFKLLKLRKYERTSDSPRSKQ